MLLNRPLIRSILISSCVLVAAAIPSAQPDAQDFPEVESARFDAIITPVFEATLTSLIADRITAIHIKEGESFEKGEALLSYDCHDQETNHKIAAADLQAAQARLMTLHRLKELQSLSDLDMQMAEAEHLKLQGQEEKASYLVAQCTLHAPAAATVQEIHVAPFEKVEQDAPLLTVVSAKNLQIEFEVPASLAGKLSVGTKLELSVDEINQNHTIEITSIVPVVNKTTKTFRVIAKTTRDAGLLIPGMTGNVKFSGF